MRRIRVVLLISFAIVFAHAWSPAPGRGEDEPRTPMARIDGEDEPRTPLARIDGETLYVEDVEGAVALRIFKHELDIYSLLVSEAQRRIESRLLESEAKKRGLAVEALLAQIEGADAAVSEADVERYLVENPLRPGTDPARARERVRHYLSERVKIERRVAYLDALRASAGTRILLEKPEAPRTEVDIEGAPVRGPESAPVVIVHFASFGSRNSARSTRKLDRLRAEFPGAIRQVHLNFLNDRDEMSLAAARIATIARQQDSFWKFHDALFQSEGWRSIDDLVALAAEHGIGAERARSATRDAGPLAAVKKDIDAAIAAGAPREPTLFINGRFLSGILPYDEIKEVVVEELERARETQL